MKILVTYFEAFDGRTENSTGLAVRAYQQEIPQNEDVVFLELPVIFSNCWLLLEKHLSENKYDYILALGEASLRKIVTVERVALNWVDARIPDNEGFQPQEQQIDPTKKAAYFSSVSIKKLVKALNENKIDCEESLTAGSYVCNFLMFHLYSWAEDTKNKAVFVHLPLCDSQTNKIEQSFSIKELTKTLKVILKFFATPVLET